MTKYSAKIPLIIENLSMVDTHEKSYSSDIELTVSATDDLVEIEITMKGEIKEARLSNVVAQNEHDAFKIICNIMSKVKAILTFKTQLNNPNRHLCHTRINWKPSDIEITPRDSCPSESFSSKMIQQIKHMDLQGFIIQINNSQSLEFLFNSYYEALSPTDFRSKFYNAFTIIEYIEDNFTSCIKINPLISGDECNDLKSEVEEVLKKLNLCKIRNKMCSLIGTLKTSTSENRKEKLFSIIKDVFGINELKYGSRTLKINRALTDQFIDTRNKLFHGYDLENPEKSLIQIVNELIFLDESILLVINDRIMGKS